MSPLSVPWALTRRLYSANVIGTRHQRPCCQFNHLHHGLSAWARLRTSVVIWRHQRKGRETQQVGWTALGRHEVIQTSNVLWSVALSIQRCPHSMRNGVYVTVGCPSVCVSRWLTAVTAASGFAAERPAGRRYRSIAADPLRASFSRRRRSAADAGSIMPRADGGSTETCFNVQLEGSRIYGTGDDSPVSPQKIVGLDGCMHFVWFDRQLLIQVDY